jgi:Pvc16 N-terminal domain
MSNHLAIATVTAVLRKTLQEALDVAQPQVAGARVTTTRPNAPQADLPNPGVNIFLYQTTPSQTLRNMDLPRRRTDMTILQRPQAALDLHYLLTFHGADPRLEPQIMHGIVTRALHEQPVITRAAIQSTLADAVFDFLQGSDLADAADLARVSPVALSVEEMGKLWSIFYQIPYVLSAAYRASVVLIESELPATNALPVRTTRLRIQASSGPSVDRVVSATDPSDSTQTPILSGQDVVLIGQGLRAAVTRVRFDDLEVAPDPAATREDRIQVAPPTSLAAGVHGVVVVHRRTAEPATLEAASTIAPFVLHPTITAELSGANVRVTFTPPVGRAQRVVVLLNEVPAPTGRASRAYVLRAPARLPTDPDTAATLDIPLSDVAPGSYLVRAQVDGAESPLVYDNAVGAYNAPKLTIT